VINLMESIDLEDPAFYAADPHAAYRQLRAQGSVFWYEPRHVWAVLGHRDVSAILRDSRTFISGQGCFLSDAGAGRSTAFADMFSDSSTVLPVTDPPRHDELRRSIGRMFTPKRVENLRHGIKQACDELIFKIEPNVPFDFVEKIASALPLRVGALVLGISPGDMADIEGWIETVDRAVSDVAEPVSLAGQIEKVRSNLQAFFARQLDDKQVAPRDDLLTFLASSENAKKYGITPNRATSFAAQIAVGGISTTRALLSGAIECLCQYAKERMKLVEDRSLVPSAIEETLRWKTPGGRGFLRTASCDAYLGEHHIRARDQVYVMLDAANRDPQAFACPEVFDISRRRDNGNLAFGLGVHACIGAPLARVEAEILLTSLIERFTDWQMLGGERTWSAFRNGWASLLTRFGGGQL
jgi:cytochrome P450